MSIGFKAPLVLLALLAGTGVVFYDTVQRIVTAWLTPSSAFSHGIMSLAIVGYFLYEKRVKIAIGETPSILLILVLFFSSLLWVSGWAGDMQAAQIAALFGILLFSTMSLVRVDQRLLTLKIVGLLAFSMPFWTAIGPLLQSLAAKAIHLAYGFFNVPILVQDTFIETSVGVFEVAGTCSGIGFIMVACTLGWGLGLMQQASLQRLVMLVTIAACIAVITNWLRIGVIIAIGLNFGIDHPIVRDHNFLGWAIFISIALPAFWLIDQSSDRANSDVKSDESHNRAHHRVRSNFPLDALLVALASLGLPSIVLLVSADEPADPSFLQLTNEFVAINTDSVAFSWRSTFPDADKEVWHMTESSLGEPIYVSQFQYRNQTHDKELINNRNRPLPAYWLREEKKSIGVKTTSGELLELPFFLMSRRGESVCVANWYRVGGASLSTAISVKFEIAFGRIRGVRDGEFVSVAISCVTLDSGIRDLLPIVKVLLADAEK